MIPVFVFFILSCSTEKQEETSTIKASKVWSNERAHAWHKEVGWLVGCNFIPSSAVNQLEMWQQETFDPATIDRELGWAGELGFNSVRVFLHDLLWEQDSTAFLERVDQFLTMAHNHEIGVMLVLFDGVWHPAPQPGKQQDPIPHVHNSGWVQSPGRDLLDDSTQHPRLEKYVKRCNKEICK